MIEWYGSQMKPSSYLHKLVKERIDKTNLTAVLGTRPSTVTAIMLYYNSHIGAAMRFKKGNEIGSATRFGPEWAGQRCCARTKAGAPCQRPAVKKTGRCTRHGGRSTGPRTEAGRARIAAAHTTHGRLTKEARAETKRRAQLGREIRAEVRAIEKELITTGLLDRNWRDLFET